MKSDKRKKTLAQKRATKSNRMSRDFDYIDKPWK